VLLAEDNAVNQEVMVDILGELGLVVDVAADGVEALALAGGRHYDLVLMDMQMPRMGGLDATRHIRALPGRAGLPILALTANAFGDDRSACLAVGMNDFITKPVDPQVLAERLQHWLAPPGAPRAPGGPK
jgi:CheY-like chemotaxis protein